MSRGPMPSIELDEMSGKDLEDLPREELDKIPFTVVRWQCCIKLCKRHTRVRDYSVAPHFYWPRAKGGWIKIGVSVFFCGKHWKHYRARKFEDIPFKKHADGSIVSLIDEEKKIII